jgi:hypothetical protein
MLVRTNFVLPLFLTAVSLITFSRCNKKTTDEDKTLFSKAMNADLTYYKNDSSYLGTTPASGHAPAYFRVKYNAIAAAALSDSGKLPIGGAFPDGSIVVKELYDTPHGPVQLIAIIQKSTGNSLAGANWLWGEYYVDGSPGISITRKGAQCTGCHDDAGNRDYVRSFAFYP